MNWILSNWDVALEVAGAVLTAASLITALTPTPADDAVVARLVSWLSFLKHKDAPGTLKAPLVAHKE